MIDWLSIQRRLDPWPATLWLTLAIAALHLLVADRVPLSADEAHYALYGLHVDWSYFDHPPLVGWLQALVLRVSSSEFALRLWPIALSSVTALTLFIFARHLFPDASPWQAFGSVALYHAAVLFQLLGLALVPETPLMLFALLAMLFLLRALDTGRISDWLLLGIALGLAGLAKYTAVTLVLTIVLFVLFQKRLAVLRTPGPWLAIAAAGLLIAPVLYWNAQHDWISFRYQLGHGFRPKAWEWSRVGLSQLGQAFAYAPLLYVAGLIALITGLRLWRERGIQLTLLLVLPVLVLFASASGREETLPHWTALAWAGVCPLAVHWLVAHWSQRPVRILAYVSAGYSFLVLAVLHLLLLVPTLPVPGQRHPLAPLAGWPAATEQAGRLLTAMHATQPDAVLFVPNWSLASRLAWYARPQRVQIPDERFDQFDLWFGSPATGSNGVMVVPDYALKSTRPVLDRFAHCEGQEPLPVVANGRNIVTFHFYLCRDYRGPHTAPDS